MPPNMKLSWRDASDSDLGLVAGWNHQLIRDEGHRNPMTVDQLAQFFVRRDRRRSGIGRAAFAILREQVWPRGVRLTVDVLCRNHGGIAFWCSVGYRDYCLTLEITP
jgi:GNAT superfamily N-acetyltransferase